ncbi:MULTISPECIES: hypothetical protein [unclassified Sphingobium]|uniref:hypothetical protein n=2 Tax=Sphingomonadaceae TaxID=41297 RepID=UPI0015ECD3DC|nr:MULTISPECIES: hypothetical protein [unclassified Sphingobium]MCW2363934.1 hypothetical protein [Sphingobium sp. B10D3B]MCW2402669.1 hypothetical protein [Sphingobium sp. B10D7B]MCW2409648.1 hypothetical protein [Sphingobium xanthum]
MDNHATCPFCHAHWTQEMIDQLERFSSAGGCACCSLTPDLVAHQPLETPKRDLCCATCGKAIYLAPNLFRHHIEEIQTQLKSDVNLFYF